MAAPSGIRPFVRTPLVKPVTSGKFIQAELAPIDEEGAAEIEDIEAEEAAEFQEPRIPPAAARPPQDEVDSHIASGHAVFRSWCVNCPNRPFRTRVGYPSLPPSIPPRLP